MWRYLNKNPQARDVNDCVIRSISCAEGRSWDDVYDELSDLAQEQGIILDDARFVEPYLDSKYERTCYDKNGEKMKRTLSETPYWILIKVKFVNSVLLLMNWSSTLKLNRNKKNDFEMKHFSFKLTDKIEYVV